MRYRYKLEGADDDWSPVTTGTHATYSYLQPGKYTFYVRSCNNDGIWNKGAVSYDIFIMPPFWKTLWFSVLAFLAAALGVYGLIRLRVKKLEKVRQLLEKKVLERTGEVIEEKEKVEEANRELKEYREHLEDLVARRTSELENTNRKLHREILERKQAEEIMRESKDRFRALIESQGKALAFRIVIKILFLPTRRLKKFLGFKRVVWWAVIYVILCRKRPSKSWLSVHVGRKRIIAGPMNWKSIALMVRSGFSLSRRPRGSGVV